MRITGLKSFFSVLTAVFVIAGFLAALSAPPPQAAQRSPASGAALALASGANLSLALDPAQSKVHWTLPSSLHTVHGTFEVTRGALNFERDTGKASGEIVVNAKSGQSGNDGRDSKMHKEILETAKYPEVVFHPAQVEGMVAASGPSDVQVRGTLTVHGSGHEITAQVHEELTGETWKGTAKFDVPYVEWGIKNPSNFFLKASKVVSLEVEMAGSVQSRQ